MCVTSCFCKTDASVAHRSACEVGNGLWLLNLASKAHVFMITPQWSVFSHSHIHILIYPQGTDWQEGGSYVCTKIIFKTTRMYRKRGERWRRDEKGRRDGEKKVKVVIK